MSLSDLEEIIAVTTYKPGWSFGLAREKYNNGDGTFSPALVVRIETVDATDDPRLLEFRPPYTVCHYYKIGDIADRSVAINYLFHLINLTEIHEAGEFFCVNHERPFNPHEV